MSPALTQPELFALLRENETVLLPTAHAARTLKARAKQAMAAEVDPLLSGSVLAWPEWTAALWSTVLVEGLDDRVLMNRAQEEQLWTEVIRAHPATPGVHATTSYAHAGMARSALHLAAAYNATDRLRSAADSFDARTFATWMEAFRDHCTRQRLLAPAFLDQALARHLRDRRLPLPSRLFLVGFEQQTPAQRDLISALHTAGCEVRSSDLQHAAGTLTGHLAITAPDPEAELRFAVQWVRQQAQREAGSFALVLPAPREQRPELERLLRLYIAPELDAISADLSATPWQFTDGTPLASLAMVKHALALLQWLTEPLPIEQICTLLRSPYLTYKQSWGERARLEAELLRDGLLLRPELSLSELLEMRRSSSQDGQWRSALPELQRLERISTQKSFGQVTRSYGDWTEQVRSVLEVLGWPGSRAPSPTEFATAKRWEEVLDVLATLDLFGRRVTFQDFMVRLEREVEQTSIFAPHTTAPIQILTLDQTVATVFDHVLLLHATGTHLPAQESAHPLISRRLQSSLSMPGTDPAQAYERAKAALESLALRSGALHMVAPATDANGPVRFSGLGQDLDFLPVLSEEVLSQTAEPEPVPLVPVAETPLPALSDVDVVGGARVLELQAKCGFQAFAEFRLRASQQEAPSFGIDARGAGNVLHASLNALWTSLKGQSELRSMPTDARRQAIREAVEEAMRPLRRTPSAQQPWSRAFLEILQGRFEWLLQCWLAYEMERGPFSTLAQEVEHKLKVGPLNLKVRLDRVDQVENGLVFVDYKTGGMHNPEHWSGDRPDAPQLPLYTLTSDADQVRGIAFARVRPGKSMGWASLSDTPGVFPGSSKKGQVSSLAEEIERWREVLTGLAFDFAEGRAEVNPKSYPKTCEHCAHRLLCRLDPTELLAQDTEEDATTEHELG